MTGQHISPDEWAELLELGGRLAAAPVPEPDPDETGRLIAQLAACLPPVESPVARALGDAAAPGPVQQALAMVRPQVRILRRPFWVASALLVAAGLPLVAPDLRASVGADFGYAGYLLIIAPVLSCLGAAYAFRSAGTGMGEIEMSCALTPGQLVLGRLFWVAAYDTALLGAASLAAAGLEPGVALGWLVLGWLAPTLLLALLVLGLSFWLPPRVSAAGALALWAGTAGLWMLPLKAGSAAIWPAAALLGLGAVLLGAAVVAGAPRLARRLGLQEGGW